ncbi:putative tubulin polyglutamylase TTLL2 [Armadillidium vulgare]|nr:putative tubulin polyglutamylase TTLL2 [Armadillidium vulgare]
MHLIYLFTFKHIYLFIYLIIYSFTYLPVSLGCKWTLRQLRRHFKVNCQNDWLLWQKVQVLVTLTLLSQVSRIAYNNNNNNISNTFAACSDQSKYGTCFELYGFDILIDENLTPWLLEVNRCPSLTYDCDVDRVVKKPLLHHLFDLVGPPKVSQRIGSSHRIAGESALYYKESGTNLKGSSSVDKIYSRRHKRASICEDCDDSLSKSSSSDENLCPSDNSHKQTDGRMNFEASKSVRPSSKSSLFGSISRSEGNINRKISSSRTSKRRKSATSLKEDIANDFVAEETCRDSYVPLTINSTFQRLRRQLIMDYTVANRYYTTGLGWNSPLENIAKPLPFRQDGRPQHKHPSKCGDWIRTFPYNAATLHGSRNPLCVKSLITELLKYRKTCEKTFREAESSDHESLDNQIRKLLWADHVLWSPKTV